MRPQLTGQVIMYEAFEHERLGVVYLAMTLFSNGRVFFNNGLMTRRQFDRVYRPAPEHFSLHKIRIGWN